MNGGLLTGDAESLAPVASVVHEAVLHEPVVRVKIWSATARSSTPTSRLIGDRYELDDEELEVLDTAAWSAEVSDLERAGEPLRALLRAAARGLHADRDPRRRRRLLFETYQLASSIAGNRPELASTFAPVLVATLARLSRS